MKFIRGKKVLFNGFWYMNISISFFFPKLFRVIGNVEDFDLFSENFTKFLYPNIIQTYHNFICFVLKYFSVNAFNMIKN